MIWLQTRVKHSIAVFPIKLTDFAGANPSIMIKICKYIVCKTVLFGILNNALNYSPIFSIISINSIILV